MDMNNYNENDESDEYKGERNIMEEMKMENKIEKNIISKMINDSFTIQFGKYAQSKTIDTQLSIQEDNQDNQFLNYIAKRAQQDYIFNKTKEYFLRNKKNDGYLSYFFSCPSLSALDVYIPQCYQIKKISRKWANTYVLYFIGDFVDSKDLVLSVSNAFDLEDICIPLSLISLITSYTLSQYYLLYHYSSGSCSCCDADMGVDSKTRKIKSINEKINFLANDLYCKIKKGQVFKTVEDVAIWINSDLHKSYDHLLAGFLKQEQLIYDDTQ